MSRTIIDSRIAICHNFCGPTYKKSCIDKLTNHYRDHDDVYYFVITDDTKPFENIPRRNLVVKNIKDFHEDYPNIKKYEPYLEAQTPEEYAQKFRKQKYRFPFSTNRLHLRLAAEYDIKNVAMMATDSFFRIEQFKNIPFRDNILYNLATHWYTNIPGKSMELVKDILEEEFNITCGDKIHIFDAACKTFCFESVDFMLKFLNIWDVVLTRLYDKNLIGRFQGSYAVNNEYILGPIYDAIGISGPPKHNICRSIMTVNHDQKTERFWA